MFVVTGATGHIGNNVVRLLLEHQASVKVLVRRVDQSIENLPIIYAIGDVFSMLFLDTHINPGDVVIHAAGYIDLMNRDKIESFRTNYRGTKHVVDTCLKKGVRMVYLSTVDIIPKPKKGSVLEPKEILKRYPKSYYQTSKALATRYVLEKMNEGLNAMVLYPSAVIGIHDYKPSRTGVELMKLVRHRLMFALSGGYNFIDVCDVAKSIYAAATSSVCDHVILSGYDLTIRQFYKHIIRITGQFKIVIPVPVLMARLFVLFSKNYTFFMLRKIQDNYRYDHTKMKRLLLRELTPIEKTISDTIRWFNKENES